MSSSTLKDTIFFELPKDSFIAQLHPSLLLVSLGIFNVIAWLLEDMGLLFLFIGLTLLSFKLASVPFNHISRRIIPIIIIVQAPLVSYMLTREVPGNTVFYVFPWGVHLTEMGVLYASTMALKFLSMVLVSTLFLAGITERKLMYCGLPFPIAFMISLAFKESTNFIDEYERIRNAMQLRGASFSGFQKLRNLPKLAIPLMGSLIKKINKYLLILESKRFTLDGKKTTYHHFPFTFKDGLYLIFCTSLLGISLYITFWMNMFSFPGLVFEVIQYVC